MDEDAGSMERIFNCGAGAIVTKSIGLKPRKGYANPTLVELEHGLLNAMGLPNPGITEFEQEIKKLKSLLNRIIHCHYQSEGCVFEIAKLHVTGIMWTLRLPLIF